MTAVDQFQSRHATIRTPSTSPTGLSIIDDIFNPGSEANVNDEISFASQASVQNVRQSELATTNNSYVAYITLNVPDYNVNSTEILFSTSASRDSIYVLPFIEENLTIGLSTITASGYDPWGAYRPYVTFASTSTQLRRLQARLSEFSSLQANWDGEDGVPPSFGAIEAANGFLLQIPDSYLPHECHAIGDGEIVFQWRKQDCFAEVAFNGKTISWYVRIGADPAMYSDDDFFDNRLIDKRLLEAIFYFTR